MACYVPVFVISRRHFIESLAVKLHFTFLYIAYLLWLQPAVGAMLILEMEKQLIKVIDVHLYIRNVSLDS